jgi:hypothetical protein
MIRRCVLVLALVGLTGSIGCGLIRSELQKTEAHRPGAVTRSFEQWSSEVAMTAMELSGVEFTMTEGKDFDFRIGVRAHAFGATPGTKVDMSNDYPINDGDLYLESAGFWGKTADGRPVTVWVQGHDEGKKADLTVLIGRHGDPELSRSYLDRIAERLAHPPARTPEEAAERKLKAPLKGLRGSHGEYVRLDTSESQSAPVRSPE